MSVEHLPVMPAEVLELLDLAPGDTVVDATLGRGGHAALFLEQIGPGGLLIGLDADEDSLTVARSRLGERDNLRLFHQNFEHLSEVLQALNMTTADAIFADLGVNSAQIADPQRGFSFREDGPLDMRLDTRQQLTAADMVNRLGETDLANLLFEYGQERGSRRIARAIHAGRRERRITRTRQLADLVCKALGQDPDSRRSKIHPATRTFMALRIAVNRELETLTGLVASLPDLLRPGGRAVVLSFHSLEDGICKAAFRRGKQEGRLELLTRKPLTPTPEERARNPRARSAKLRAVKRISMD